MSDAASLRFRVKTSTVVVFAVLFGLLLALVFVPVRDENELLRNCLEGALIVLILSLVIVLNRRTTKRLRELSEVAQRIGRGEREARAEIALRAGGDGPDPRAARVFSSPCLPAPTCHCPD